MLSQVEACAVVLPKSYSNNSSLLRAIGAKEPHLTPKRSTIPANLSESERDSDESGANSCKTAKLAPQPISKEERGFDHPVDDSSSPTGSAERQVTFLANNEFGLSKSTALCRFIKLRGMSASTIVDDRLAYLSHLLEEDDCILRAVGGLLSFIVQNGLLGSLGDDNESIQINAIRSKNYCNVLRVSPTSLRALQVFSQDAHPVKRGSIQAKEGLSLFGILQSHVKTASARKLLRTWLTFPSTSLNTIRERQCVVDALRKGSNSAVLLALKEALRGVKNIPAILSRFRKSISGPTDWKALYSSLKSFVVIQDTLKVFTQQNEELQQSQLLKKACSIVERDLRECLGWIDTVVDFEESTIAGRMVVAHGFSEEIDEMKRCYSGLDDFLTNVGAQEHRRLMEREEAPSFSSFHFTYQPQIGYLVVISEADCDRIGVETLEDSGMSFVFSSPGDGYHFKSSRCKELDEELGDVHGAIIDLEEKAFRYLKEKIFSFDETLLSMAHVARELDCLQAFACVANEYSWTKPFFSQDCSGLVIEEGRHPIVEFVVSSFVPNSSRLNFGDVHVITG